MTGQGANPVSTIPALGAGLGYRRELKEGIFGARAAIDFLEIVTEQFLYDPTSIGELEEICDRFVAIPHGIGLSIGSPSLDSGYLRAIKRVSDVTGAPYYSDHLAMTRVPGIDIGHLSPLWFTTTVLRNTIDNVHRVQDALNKPLVLENITYAFEIPSAPMRQAEFFARLVEATGCGILLDVTNVHINSVNHGFDPVAFLGDMPLDRVVQVHLAGGYSKDGILIDSHSERVEAGSWALLERLVEITTIKGSILEHDANFPADFDRLLEQVERARAIIAPVRATVEP
jgi:uncharacterized protein (UPF0276 family)